MNFIKFLFLNFIFAVLFFSTQAETEAPEKEICPCPRILDYMCGSDGDTYDNLCLLKCQQLKDPNLQKAYDGECEETTKAA